MSAAGNFSEARQAFQQALEMQPNCFEAYNDIGLSYYRANDLDKAAENFMKALELEPVFVPSITNLGLVRHQQRRLKEATNLYRLALRLSEGKEADIQYNLANVLREQKIYDEARQHYNEAIKLKSDFPAAHNGLGATLYCLERLDDAEKEIRTAISLKPDYALAYYHLGLVETAKKNYDEAVKAYKNSLKFEDRNDYASDTKSKLAHLDQLMKDKTSAVNMPPVPDSSQQNNGLAQMLNAFTGKSNPPETSSGAVDPNVFKRTAGILKSMLQKNSKDPVLWNNYGLMVLQQRDRRFLPEAISAFKKANQLSGGTMFQSHYNLAQALKTSGNMAEAEKECTAAINAAQSQSLVCPLAHNLRALILKSKGQLAKADEEYRVAIAQSTGKYPVLHYNRAILLERMSKNPEAKREYKTYLDKSPGGFNAERAKLRLNLLSM